MMKSYKTYQECKIANPECEVVEITQKAIDDFNEEYRFEAVVKSDEWESGYEFLDGYSSPRIADGYWNICHPSDHCMTVKEFLDAGYRFEVGDVVLHRDEGIYKIELYPSIWNEKSQDDEDELSYILRAAALESRQLKQYAVLYKGGSYSFQSDKPVGDDIVACFDLSHSEAPLGCDFFEEKPRIKVEWVNVNPNEDGEAFWEVARDFAEFGVEFRSYQDKCKIKDNLMLLTHYSNRSLQRRIETTMTEREAFIDKAKQFCHQGESTEACLGSMFDAGCRFAN